MTPHMRAIKKSFELMARARFELASEGNEYALKSGEMLMEILFSIK